MAGKRVRSRPVLQQLVAEITGGRMKEPGLWT